MHRSDRRERLGGGPGGVAGAHRATYATVVVEENASRSRRPDYKLIGHLESSKEACLRNRTMKFLARTADGATVVLGTGRTNGSGTWRLVGDETTTHGERLKVTQKSREVVNSINDWLGRAFPPDRDGAVSGRGRISTDQRAQSCDLTPAEAIFSARFPVNRAKSTAAAEVGDFAGRRAA